MVQSGERVQLRRSPRRQDRRDHACCDRDHYEGRERSDGDRERDPVLRESCDATGYRSDYSWIDLPVFELDGRPRHRRGVTEIPGLYFLGLSWQHTRGSALIGWVGDDAEFIATEIEAAASLATGTTTTTNHDYEGVRLPEAASAIEGV